MSPPPKLPRLVSTAFVSLTLLLMLVLPAGADHVTIVVDGDLSDLEAAVADHLGLEEGGFAVSDNLGDIYPQTCAYVNGYDLRRVLAFFDSKTADGQPSGHTTLYLGFRSEGIIGDVDGDGDPTTFTLGSPGRASGCATSDLPAIGPNEQYTILVDVDCDGLTDLRIGVTNNQLVRFTASGMLIGTLPGQFATNGSQLEVRIDNVEDVIPPEGHGCRLSFYASAADDGMGEDASIPIQIGENLADPLQGIRVISLLVDHAGDVWAGTEGAGVSRFDGTAWRTYTSADGLAANDVETIAEDAAGGLWFGTWGGGASYFVDGVGWTTYREGDGLASNYIRRILVDQSGAIWFATSEGVTRFDGTAWRTYTVSDGLGADGSLAIEEDAQGSLWVGTFGGGVSRFDGSTWQTYTVSDGLADDIVWVIEKDPQGGLWFGTQNGVSQFDGANWATLGADSIGSPRVFSILAHQDGSLWFGREVGLSRRQQGQWTRWDGTEGPSGFAVMALAEDNLGTVWVGTEVGVYCYRDGWDRCTPDASSPAPVGAELLSTRFITLAYEGAFPEIRPVAFHHSFDGGSWSEWSSRGSWTGRDLPDGFHSLQAVARDSAMHESRTRYWRFRIDATAPTPEIRSPVPGQVVQDSIVIRGTADDPRFRSYEVSCRSRGKGSWSVLADSTLPVADGFLAGWNTRPWPDGEYDLQLSIEDTLGLRSSTAVPIIVDNEPPWAIETSPAEIVAANGGDVYTVGREAHLYLPPHAFAEDVKVTIAPLDSTLVPDLIGTNAKRVLPGYDVSWEGLVLQKTAILDVSLEGISATPEGPPAVYFSADSSTWRRLGGTMDPASRRITTPIDGAGWYAVFADGGIGSIPSVSALSLSPRVFAPAGGFGGGVARIGFNLGQSAPVTVRIYNRAGRVVREVSRAQTFGPGANVVSWDGRDAEGKIALDGLYLVSVEALGARLVGTLGIVH